MENEKSSLFLNRRFNIFLFFFFFFWSVNGIFLSHWGSYLLINDINAPCDICISIASVVYGEIFFCQCIGGLDGGTGLTRKFADFFAPLAKFSMSSF